MRVLYLLRHAKSDWGDSGARDFDRPLAPRGRRDAPAMAAYMATHAYRPDRVLCSPAARTRETWALLRPVLGPDIPVDYDRELYLGSRDRLLQCLRTRGGAAKSLLLIGHNPGLEELASALAATGDRLALAAMREKYPTTGLAVIDLAIQRWAEIDHGAGTLADFMAPKRLDKP
jgi:phosphohistidine phosphatase